ncbi:MAG TPA: helix-turn-helix domain-containing protein [Prolixibacteraceae bacterium]|nr:helix-turn-helix domain-containing protein [Prolixibacteraceae bacterium]
MDDVIRAILHINEEIKEIKKQIEILKKRPDVLFKEDWMDGQDVMLALNISQRTLRTLRLTGALSFTRLHKKIFYKVSDIKSLLEQNYIRYHFTNNHDQ